MIAITLALVLVGLLLIARGALLTQGGRQMRVRRAATWRRVRPRHAMIGFVTVTATALIAFAALLITDRNQPSVIASDRNQPSVIAEEPPPSASPVADAPVEIIDPSPQSGADEDLAPVADQAVPAPAAAMFAAPSEPKSPPDTGPDEGREPKGGNKEEDGRKNDDKDDEDTNDDDAGDTDEDASTDDEDADTDEDEAPDEGVPAG